MTDFTISIPVFGETAGLVPQSDGDANKVLHGDGQFRAMPSGGGGNMVKFRLPGFVELFGPIPGDGYVGSVGPSYNFITAVTASTKTFNFHHDFPNIVWAVWKLIWIPINTSAGARLIHMDDGATNIATIAEFPGVATSNPIPSAVAVTSQLQALQLAGQYKHIGFQMRDNGTPWRIYESRLEITWELS